MQKPTIDTSDFSFMDAFKRAYAHMQLEWQVVFLVGILYSILDLLIHAPILTSYLTSLNADALSQSGGGLVGDGGSRSPDSKPELTVGYAEFAYIPMFLVGAMGHTFWGRFLLLGRDKIFTGGYGDYMSRVFQVMWRVICLIGWLVIFMVPLMYISNIILPNLPASFATILAIIIISLLFLTGYSVLGPPVLAATIDKPLTIKQSWKMVGPYRPRFRQALMGLALAFLILAVGIMQLHGSLASIFGESILLGVMVSFIGGIMSMILNFLWLHMTWQLVHHIDPDLLNPNSVDKVI